MLRCSSKEIVLRQGAILSSQLFLLCFCHCWNCTDLASIISWPALFGDNSLGQSKSESFRLQGAADTLLGCSDSPRAGKLIENWAPGRIRPVIWRRHREFGAAKHVRHVNLWAFLPPRIAKKHKIEAIRRPGRPLVVKPLGQDPFAGAVRAHDANCEAATLLLREGNKIA